ncbi:MAG: acyclic terpene utilization AtuA family protein [Candidatus Promineifilaceae bacterium]
MKNVDKVINIGGAAGAWGDSSLATAQLLASKKLDYIVYEGLAEVTMAILTRAKMKNPQAGYAIDFINPVLKTHLREIREQGIRVVTNAGGINPQAAAEALREIAAAQAIPLKVAVVEGDNLMPQLEQLRAADVREMAHDTPLPKKVLAMNAYLGAFPIAAALDAGADVVITGRVVDSALMLAPCIHEFGWTADEYDKLAQGSLAGHLLECGPQSTGGLLTDWESVESWVNIGYPIAEVSADSSFILTKADGTDGLVNIASATEQILYEIGNPRAYILPDVVCNFAEVTLTQVGNNRVLVENAKGSPPPPTYKACTLEMDGYRLFSTLLFTGRNAVGKAQRVADTLFERMRRVYAARGIEDFRATSVEIMGGESQFGPHSNATGSREVVLKIAAHHNNKHALSFFAREIPSSALSMAQSIIGFASGLPRPMPFIRLHSIHVPREFVTISVSLDNEPLVGAWQTTTMALNPPAADNASEDVYAGETVDVSLLDVAYGRSGDKGNICNVGIVARRPELVAVLRRELSAEKVKQYLSHLVEGHVERFELPGLNAFNFVMHDALGGGGTASLRFDPLGKGMAQILLEMPIAVPVMLIP